jgi:predicted AAA+ superfamily ATPase
LIGCFLEPWLLSKKRKAIQTAKFYFFDIGVTHALLGLQNLERVSPMYGKAFEQFIWMELRAYISYQAKHEKLYFWRSKNQHEVDFIIGDSIAIEVKATNQVLDRHLNGLKALQSEGIIKSFYIVSQDPIEKKESDIWCINWEKFLHLLWAGDIF